MTLKVELSEHAYNKVDSINLGRVMSAINAIKRGEVQEPKNEDLIKHIEDGTENKTET